MLGIERKYNRAKHVFRAYMGQKKWEYLAIHRRSITALPSFLVLPLFCGHVKGKLKCPPELTIMLIHNYKNEPILEKSLRYVGIDNFVVVNVETSGEWYNTLKLVALKNFIDSDRCNTEYILFFDSDDVILRDDPEKAIKYLQEENCDMLLSSTRHQGGYQCMPHIKEMTDQIADENGNDRLYICSGVYVAKVSFLREVLDEATKYITDNELSREDYRRLQRQGTLCEKFPSFPKGVGCDQLIIRYLYPEFYPRMKIDSKDRLALRNLPPSLRN